MSLPSFTQHVDLSDKTAIVTGASGGPGRAIGNLVTRSVFLLEYGLYTIWGILPTQPPPFNMHNRAVNTNKITTRE